MSKLAFDAEIGIVRCEGPYLNSGYGIWVNELWIPWVRRVSVTLSGFPALLMFMAILCAVTVLVTEIIDHYDTRENERTYNKVALIFQYLGIALFVIAFLSGLVSNAISWSR
ncbi:MAG: hypothetical protein ACJAYN_002423 [Bermanella sp.]